MLKKLINIAISLAAVLMCAAPVSARSIKASLDSSQITMGYQTAIRLDIVDNAGSPAQLLVDKAALPPEVEPIDWVDGDTTDLGNGLMEIKRALIVQSFDSGVYTIPPFLLVSGPDTVRSNALTLKVLPVDVSEMKDINPIAPALSFETKWYDWLPDWFTDNFVLLLSIFLVIIGGVCVYLIFANRKKVVAMLPRRKPVPPYQLAMQRLTELREDNLWQNGREREYYTRLIDILRDYLQGRFGINAMEMTSQQIIRTLNEKEETRMSNARMRRILEIADYVKFAKVRPMPDDNHRALADAIQFVEETKPVEVPAPGTPGQPDGKPGQPAGNPGAAPRPVADKAAPKPAAPKSPDSPKNPNSPVTPNTPGASQSK